MTDSREVRLAAFHEGTSMKSMPTLIAIIMLTSAALASGADAKQNKPANEGTHISVEGTSLTFDPKTVMRGGGGQCGFGWGFGSVRVVILGREDNSCVFDFTDEVEGGFRVYRCRVPLDKPVRIDVQKNEIVTSFKLNEDMVIRGGNILLELPGTRSGPQLEWKENIADVIVGTGAAAQRGKRVSIRCRFFADDSFHSRMLFCSEFVGIERYHDLSFTLGESKVGGALEQAVLGMKVHGRRLAVLSDEAAPLIVERLGGVQPGTQLGIEIELVKVE